MYISQRRALVGIFSCDDCAVKAHELSRYIFDTHLYMLRLLVQKFLRNQKI